MGGGIEAALLLALQAVLSGVLVGGVYGILSVGLSLAFGVMRRSASVRTATPV